MIPGRRICVHFFGIGFLNMDSGIRFGSLYYQHRKLKKALFLAHVQNGLLCTLE